MKRLLFFGGNGHCAFRLAAARRVDPSLEIVDVAYPGFAGRPRAESLEGFLDALAPYSSDDSLVYATGIGALIVLCLRARGELASAPVLFQGPVLWGLEQRRLPRVMRTGLARRLVPWLFATRAFQSHFVRTHFQWPLTPRQRAAFFGGYAACVAFADLFAWFTPELLRSLEVRLTKQPAALDRIEVWWGGRDQVVTLEELRLTEAALGVRWPLRVFPGWGHYPMLDEPQEWIAALRFWDPNPVSPNSVS
jgi:pimeloyl-ACP methyl ester carboxylesterase